MRMDRVTVGCVLAMVLRVGLASGQTTSAQPPASGVASPSTGQAPSTSAGQPPPASSGQGEPQGYTYNPDGRRDPFVSLLSGSEGQRQGLGARPSGLAGLSSSEISLKGTMQSLTGYVALVQGADNKTYIVKPGDKLLDGTVRTITATTMVILQQVNDPLSLQKEREVRKVLRQAEEVK